ncbi:hypothetical protein INR49_029450 [Caranx melampygus]|nr:hypothetical protein INR49_029450 [Caranx melampygus]
MTPSNNSRNEDDDTNNRSVKRWRELAGGGGGGGVVLLLGHDEGDAGALRVRRSPLQSAAVEHGQRGQRWRDTSASSHVPQFICVVVDVWAPPRYHRLLVDKTDLPPGVEKGDMPSLSIHCDA